MTVDLTRLVKPLVWQQERDDLYAEPEGFSLSYLLMDPSSADDTNGWYVLEQTTSTVIEADGSPEAAQAAANADHAARVLAALDTEAIAALVEALRAIAETSNYTRASWMQDTARAALARNQCQPFTRVSLADREGYGSKTHPDMTAPTYTESQVAAAVKAALEGAADRVWSAHDSKDADYWGASPSDVARREKATAIRALAADPQAVARFVAQAATVPPKQ